jgi:hypothetical protein
MRRNYIYLVILIAVLFAIPLSRPSVVKKELSIEKEDTITSFVNNDPDLVALYRFAIKDAIKNGYRGEYVDPAKDPNLKPIKCLNKIDIGNIEVYSANDGWLSRSGDYVFMVKQPQTNSVLGFITDTLRYVFDLKKRDYLNDKLFNKLLDTIELQDYSISKLESRYLIKQLYFHCYGYTFEDTRQDCFPAYYFLKGKNRFIIDDDTTFQKFASIIKSKKIIEYISATDEDMCFVNDTLDDWEKEKARIQKMPFREWINWQDSSPLHELFWPKKMSDIVRETQLERKSYLVTQLANIQQNILTGNVFYVFCPYSLILYKVEMHLENDKQYIASSKIGYWDFTIQPFNHYYY